MSIYLEHKYFASCSIDVKFTVGWVVRIDTLTRQEINDILRSVLVTVSCRYLHILSVYECEEVRERKINKMLLETFRCL